MVMFLKENVRVVIEVKYCPEDANNDAGCSEKDFAKNVLDIAFDQADQAI